MDENNIFKSINYNYPESCKLPLCKECGGSYLILFIAFILLVLYFLFNYAIYGYENIRKKDFMNVKVFSAPMMDNCCSWWPISHFILFFILGLLFPNCGVTLISLGIAWEIFEMAMARAFGEERQGMKLKIDSSNIEYSQNWWAGSFKDILFNIAGFLGGWFVAKKMGIKICIKGINSNTDFCSI